nr:PHD finger protein ALFIN-LIKE 2 [Crassostrea gigas]
MGDLPPPPPPLPSINESISNDFLPPPFIEMMGNMTVDMGTPLEEVSQADEPLPSPPRLPLESVQRVPMTDLCATCGKKGSRGLLWLCCDACQQWYHRSCAGISVQAYKTIGGNPWNCRHCH